MSKLDVPSELRPIVIVANFRSGSTALAVHLARRYQLDCYSEPFHNENIGLLDQNKKHYIAAIAKQNWNFVLKFMPGQISQFNNYESILNRANFKIRLNRIDKVSQITSLYIARMMNKWHTHTNETQQEYTVPIDISLLTQEANTVLRNDFLLMNLPIKYSVDLNYEELDFLPNTDFAKSQVPNNIEELKHEVSKILNLRWNYS